MSKKTDLNYSMSKKDKNRVKPIYMSKKHCMVQPWYTFVNDHCTKMLFCKVFSVEVTKKNILLPSCFCTCIVVMYLIYLIYYGNTMIFLSTLEYHASIHQLWTHNLNAFWCIATVHFAFNYLIDNRSLERNVLKSSSTHIAKDTLLASG